MIASRRLRGSAPDLVRGAGAGRRSSGRRSIGGALALLAFLATGCDDVPVPMQEEEAPAASPRTDDLEATVVDDLIVLDWVTHASDTATFLVEASWDDGDNWQSVGLGDRNGARLVTELMAGGAVSLRVVTTDGSVTTTSDTVELTLPERGPHITIDGPEEGLVYVGHQTVRARATALDANYDRLAGGSITWSSDVDGSLGEGRDFSIDAVELTEGEHVITATAVDAANRSASASFTIVVSWAPTIETEPEPRARLDLLRKEVEVSEIEDELRRWLVAELTAAIAAIDRDRRERACEPIGAFVDELAARSEQAIASARSDDWTTKARQAAEGLGC